MNKKNQKNNNSTYIVKGFREVFEAHPGELLIDHLRLTADLAEEYGKDIGSSSVTKQLGLLHDVGKHTEKFQQVLEHRRVKIDHAIVAAEIWDDPECGNRTGKYVSDPYLNLAMGHILAGHHSSFRGEYAISPNDGLYIEELYDLPENFTKYNQTKDNGKENALSSQAEYDAILQYINNNNLIAPISPTGYKKLCAMEAIEGMLYVRMLFSCLVDADYTATSLAVTGAERQAERSIDSEKGLQCLNDFCSRFEGSMIPINELRRYVAKCAESMGRIANNAIYTLTAPTGLGKTIALMKFALEAANSLGKRRIILILPYLSIITQNVKVYRQIFGEDTVIEDDSIIEVKDEERELIDRWNGPIVITTSVKFFQMLFSAKAPELRNLHQVTNSVIVFDEAQSLPSDHTTVSIKALQTLSTQYGCTILLSTATQPSYCYRSGLDNLETKEIIPDVKMLYEKYERIKNTDIICDTEKKYNTKMLAKAFADENEVLYVVNTTNKASELYDEVKAIHRDATFLLSSRLTVKHKEVTIETVKHYLEEGKPVHLISTQCIEAGVDIDFPCGCREYAPLPSIIQTAGRINRNGRYNGKMLIFEMEDPAAPGIAYRNEAITTRQFAVLNKLAVNDPFCIEQYYRLIYGGSAGVDKGEIKDALEDVNIFKMDEAYQIIENRKQYTVIVPYKPMIELFDIYEMKYRGNGYIMNKADMKVLRPISVQIPVNEFVEKHCHRLKYRNREGIVDTNWFVADADEIYNDRKGLDMKEEKGGILL